MKVNQVEELIRDTLKWNYKIVSGGEEINVQVCPFCGNTSWHFYVNRQTGRFSCKKAQCSAKGGWYQLQRQTHQVVPVEPIVLKEDDYLSYDPGLNLKVEAYHQALWQHSQALKYLIDTRQLSRKAIMHFKIGVVKEYGKEWITIPHIYKNKILTVKYRRLDHKQYRHLRGTNTDLYHKEALEGIDTIIVTEGELDAIALWSNGYRNVVAIPGAGQWKPEWMDQFASLNKIYIAYDQDDAGKLGTKELAKKLGYERCFSIQLPLGIKDVNDFFIHSSKGKSKFGRLLDSAKVVDVPYVIKAGDSIRDIILKKKVIGDAATITTPWESLNDIIGGIVPESLVLLTSHPGCGKSTMSLQWMYHLSREGRGTGYVCIEMSSEEMTKRLLNLHTRQPIQTAEERMDAMKEFENYPLYWIDLAKHAGVRFDILAETLRDAVPRYDLQIVVVDHFHFMVRSVKYITQETGKLAQQFKLLARELGIPIVCIAHVTKYAGIPRRLIGTDLRDTGLLYGDSDYIFILHRKPVVDPNGEWDGEWQDKAELSVFKSRHSNKGIVKNLHFYGEIGLLT